jgi:hypothetical protein
MAYITVESLNWYVLLCFRCVLYSGCLVVLIWDAMSVPHSVARTVAFHVVCKKITLSRSTP